MTKLGQSSVLIILLLVLPACHGNDDLSGTNGRHEKFLRETVARIRDNPLPALPSGWQPDCLGRLSFALPKGSEWALEKPSWRSEESEAAFPDGVKGEGGARLAWEYNEILVSQLLTDADLVAYREYNKRNISDQSENIIVGQRMLNAAQKELSEDQAATGKTSPYLLDKVNEVKLLIEQNGYWRRLESVLGLKHEPDAYATDNGQGLIVIRLLRNGRLYTIIRGHKQLRDGNPERAKLLADLKDFVSRFRVRAPGEVPTEPGVCIPYGFIADDGKGDYETNATVRFPGHPGVTYSLDTGLKHDSGVDGTLSLPMPAPVKVYAYLGSAKEVAGGHNVQPITPRGTNIGPYEADWGGFSINAAKKGEPELRTYQIFVGEDGYTDDAGHGWQIWPLIHITMDSKLPQQVPGLTQNPPPLEESKAMLFRWLPTFRLRPTQPRTDGFERRLKELGPAPKS